MPVPHQSFFTGQMHFLPPNQQCRNTEGSVDYQTVSHVLSVVIYGLETLRTISFRSSNLSVITVLIIICYYRHSQAYLQSWENLPLSQTAGQPTGYIMLMISNTLSQDGNCLSVKPADVIIICHRKIRELIKSRWSVRENILWGKIACC